MTVLVIAEHDHATLKPATLNTVTAGIACASGDVHVLVAGANAAEADRLAADARLAAAEAPSLILAGEATQVSRLPQLARGVIGSLLVALAFWAAVYALIDRRARRVAASPPAAASGDVEGGEEGELGDDVGDPEDDRFVHGDLDLYASEPVGSGVRAAGGTFADQPRA